MEMLISSFDELPVMLNAHHLMLVLGLSKGKVYTLMNSADFPTLRFGKRLLVSKAHVLEYLDQNKNSNKNSTKEAS